VKLHKGRNNMKESVSVLRAADAAARWHVHQRRKGIAQEPYINHLLKVASLVTEANGGSDPDLVIAALLMRSRTRRCHLKSSRVSSESRSLIL
jgi:(p)ppGpp synthase/HD superfamily hydrolase